MTTIKFNNEDVTVEKGFQLLVNEVHKIQQALGNTQSKVTDSEKDQKEALQREKDALEARLNVVAQSIQENQNKLTAWATIHPNGPPPPPHGSHPKSDFGMIRSVGTFSGLDSESILVFESKIDMAATIGHLGENEKFLAVKMQTTGDALKYAMNDPVCMAATTAEEYIKGLKIRFLRRASERLCREQLTSIRMTHGETVQDFGDRVKILSAQTYQLSDDAVENRVVMREADKNARDIYTNALPDNIAFQVKLSEPATLADAIKRAVFVVEAQKKGGKPEMPQREIFAVARRGGTMRCFNCGESSHGRDLCPYSSPKCFGCNEFGHLAFQCPKRGASAAAAAGRGGPQYPQRQQYGAPRGHATPQ